MSNLYAERDIIEQGNHYSQHTSAMTGEGLHRKSDIAAELAHRDIAIERLQARVAEKCNAPVGWIAPDKYKAACESKMEFFKTIKELREQNEKMRARVANLTSALQEAADSYEGEFSRDIPDTWQQALDGQCSQPDMCWDYEGQIDHFGDLNSVAHGFADGLDPNSSGIIKVRCANQMPDRWLQVTLMDDGIDSQEVKWQWVEQPEEQGL